MDKIFHPIAKVTKTSGLRENVCLNPCQDILKSVNKKLMIGCSINQFNKIGVEKINGIGKRNLVPGFDSLDSAKTIIGKTIFVQPH